MLLVVQPTAVQIIVTASRNARRSRRSDEPRQRAQRAAGEHVPARGVRASQGWWRREANANVRNDTNEIDKKVRKGAFSGAMSLWSRIKARMAIQDAPTPAALEPECQVEALQPPQEAIPAQPATAEAAEPAPHVAAAPRAIR